MVLIFQVSFMHYLNLIVPGLRICSPRGVQPGSQTELQAGSKVDFYIDDILNLSRPILAYFGII